MQKKNTMGKVEFVLEHVYWAFIAMIWYKKVIFRCLGNASITQSHWILLSAIVFETIVGTLLNWRRNRSGCRVAVDLLIAYGIYTVITYYPIKTVFITVVIIVTTVLSSVYTVAIMSRKIANRKNLKKIIIYRLLYSMRCGQICMAVGMAVIIFTLGAGSIIGAAMMRDAPTKIFRNPSDSHADSVASNNNIDTILKLREDIWSDLKVREKINVLKKVADIEKNYLGITNEINVGTANLNGEILGYYSDRTQEVVISTNSLLYDDVYMVLDILVHEVYHCYQHRVVDAFINADEQARNLRLFNNAIYYLDEFSDYKSSTEDFGSYYEQKCESDAREYAEASVNDYYHRIHEYMEGERRNDET